MTEFEAQSLILEYLTIHHGYGEAIWGRIDLWTGVSSGLIIMAYFAPHKLTKPLTSLILGLYIAMTALAFLNALSDFMASTELFLDAVALAESQDIVSRALLFKTTDGAILNVSLTAGIIFIVGLFIGTIGYVTSMCLKNYKGMSGDSDT